MLSIIFLLKIIFCPGLKLGVELDVWCQPCALVEFDHSTYLIQDQSMFESLIKSCDVNDLLLLVEQTGNQLLDSTDLHLLTHEWEINVQIV